MKYKLRYWMIEKLVGNMPVVLNINIARPTGYIGALVKFPKPELPGIFSNNFLWDKEVDAIITPRRDVIIKA